MRLKLLASVTFLILLAGTVTSATTVSELSTSSIEPGGEFTVKATISNPEIEEATYKPLKLDLPEGLKVVDRPEQGLKQLCGSCTDERVFKVKADSDISSGTYKIKIEPDQSYSEGYGQEEQFTVTVDGHANLVVKLGRPEIEQGGQAQALLEVENIGTDTASEVVIEPRNSEISFQPGKITVDEIREGKTYTENMSLNLDESLPSGIHETAIDVYYKDETQQKTSNSKASIETLEKSDIVISSTEIEKAVKGEKTDMVIELENQGPGEAENVSTKLQCNNASVKSDKAFMGQLAEDESVPAVYELTPQKQDLECNIQISYQDSQKKQVTETITITAEERPLPVIPVTAVIGLTVLVGVYAFRR